MSIHSPYGIVIVTFNRCEGLRNALNGILRQTVKPENLVVIDNDSSDATQQYLAKLEFPFSTKIIRSVQNIGHGAALSLGLNWLVENSSCKYFIFLEDDSIAKSTLCQQMLTKIETSEYDILCLDGLKFKLGKRYRPNLSRDKITEVDFALLDGAVVSRKLIAQVGVPKADFFMMCDDLEYSKRIRKKGFKIGCIKTDAHEILHLGGGEKYSRSTLWRGYYQARNTVHILKEYFSPRELLDFLIIESKRLVGALGAKDRLTRVGLRLLGTWHGLLGKKGMTIDPKNFK
jgi:rhamnopyranosyl-N-acetylglucosaminyl-diphospho-decaprenol beta-1,3/1,4-galactofuranosyltransferase